MSGVTAPSGGTPEVRLLSMHDYRVENSNISILGHAQISKVRLFYISTGTFLQIMPMN